MPERREVYREFESFIADLLRNYSVQISESAVIGSNRESDFLVTNHAGTTAVVEARLYQSLKVASDLWRRTFEQLEGARERTASQIGLLVTNARLPSAIRAEIPKNITVWDYDAISFLVGNDPRLAPRWEQISQEGFIHRSEPLPEAQPVPVEFVTPRPTPPPAPRAPSGKKPEGADLCRRLKAIKAGRGKPAIEFEKACIDALKYLFDGDLINWSPQKNSDGRLHRYDLIARIASQNDFWNSLVADHRARYVIFEFKNYKDRIAQTEVYSTEKYLYPQAMRSTGIIISREGANRNAVRVMHGAFREAGKLILCLDIEQMCIMLHRRDRGEDPASVLADIIEQMLVGLER